MALRATGSGCSAAVTGGGVGLLEVAMVCSLVDETEQNIVKDTMSHNKSKSFTQPILRHFFDLHYLFSIINMMSSLPNVLQHM